MLRIHLLIVLTLFSLIPRLGLTTESKPTPNWYHVELIIFQHDNANPASEHWPEIQKNLNLNNVINLLPDPANNEGAYSMLPEASFLLKDEAKKINNNPEYHILFHTAWNQPAESNGAIQKLYFHTEEDLLPTGRVPDNETLPADLEHLYELEGVLSLRRSRFLHLNTDLLVRMPLQLDDESENQGFWSRTPSTLKTIHIKKSTKMRSGELHYLDHPLIGILAQVTPTEAPALELPEEPTLQDPALQEPTPEALPQNTDPQVVNPNNDNPKAEVQDEPETMLTPSLDDSELE